MFLFLCLESFHTLSFLSLHIIITSASVIRCGRQNFMLGANFIMKIRRGFRMKHTQIAKVNPRAFTGMLSGAQERFLKPGIPLV